MKSIFVDTNVVLDLLANREPFVTDAGHLFQLAENGVVKIYISAVSYSNLYYILKKQLSNAATNKLLKAFSELVDIADVTKLIIQNAQHSDFNDFEDAIQYYCALSIPQIDVIVTRNTKDFKNSQLAVMTPSEVLTQLADRPH